MPLGGEAGYRVIYTDVAVAKASRQIISVRIVHHNFG